MKFVLTLIAASLLLAGCKTGSGLLSHAVFQELVTVGEEVGLATHPEATPFVRVAVPIVCSVANGTNVSAQAIVDALKLANFTNAVAQLIINGSLVVFNQIVSNISSNQTQVKAYAQDLCIGMQNGLPVGPAARRKQLPPHL